MQGRGLAIAGVRGWVECRGVQGRAGAGAWVGFGGVQAVRIRGVAVGE